MIGCTNPCKHCNTTKYKNSALKTLSHSGISEALLTKESLTFSQHLESTRLFSAAHLHTDIPLIRSWLSHFTKITKMFWFKSLSWLLTFKLTCYVCIRAGRVFFCAFFSITFINKAIFHVASVLQASSNPHIYLQRHAFPLVQKTS